MGSKQNGLEVYIVGETWFQKLKRMIYPYFNYHSKTKWEREQEKLLEKESKAWKKHHETCIKNRRKRKSKKS